MKPDKSRNLSEIEQLAAELNLSLNDSTQANCFNAVQLFWEDTDKQVFVGSEEFIVYMAKHFTQVRTSETGQYADVIIVWSRNESSLPIGKINLNDLILKRQGYPFGLIIEHAFVIIENGNIFQKPDPKSLGLYQIIFESEALSPYLKINGYEITRHRRSDKS